MVTKNIQHPTPQQVSQKVWMHFNHLAVEFCYINKLAFGLILCILWWIHVPYQLNSHPSISSANIYHISLQYNENKLPDQSSVQDACKPFEVSYSIFFNNCFIALFVGSSIFEWLSKAKKSLDLGSVELNAQPQKMKVW